MKSNQLYMFEVDYIKEEEIYRLYLTNRECEGFFMDYTEKELKILIRLLKKMRKILPKRSKRR